MTIEIPGVTFDQYSALKEDGGYDVFCLLSNLSLLSATIMAGIDERDFIESVERSGWVGTCPQWIGYLPVVTLPSGDNLSPEQLGFMMETILLAKQ